MKKLNLLIALSLLFSSCTKTIIVWSISDIIALSLLILTVTSTLILILIFWIKEKINNYRNNKQQ